MKLEDIIALAKQGYKPADIKELVALAEVEQPKEEPKEQPKEEPKEQPKEEPKEKPKEEPKENNKEIEELKKMIAEQSSRLADSQKALEEIQKGYTREDVTDNGKTPTLEDIVRDFY